MNQFLTPKKTGKATITVAVALNGQAKALIQTAVGICKATNATLRVVHVCEASGYLRIAGEAYGPINEFRFALEGELFRKAESDLQQLIEPFKFDTSIKLKVMTGGVAENILDDLKQSESNLLIVAVPSSLKSFVPEGFSTALTLMANAEVPVLAVPFNKEINLDDSYATIIICDDLSEGNSLLVETGVDLASALSMDVMHIHVNGLEKDQLEAAVTLAAAAGHSPMNVSEVAADLSKAYIEVMRKRMEQRTGSRKAQLEDAGCKYECAILTGQLDVELDSYLQANKDVETIVAYGRHRTFYQKPFAFGRRPFRAMLRSNMPILVVPTHAL